jgi:hypothetical protein
MAVTIHESPNTWSLSDDPIRWVFSSNQTAQPNFSYIIEIYVAATLVSTHKLFPISGIYSTIDISEDVKALVSAPTLEPISPATTVLNNATAYIIVRENYGSTPINQASATSSTINIWKGRVFLKRWIGLDTDDYVFTINGSKWLTDCPRISVRKNETLQLFHITNNAASVTRRITYYDETGSTVGSANVITPSDRLVTKYNVSYSYLEAQCTGSFDNVAYVDVVLSNATPLVSEVIRIYIDRSCGLEIDRLHFINQLGGLDSFTFKRLSRVSQSTEVQEFRTSQGSLNNTAYIYDANYTGVGSYQVKSTQTKKIKTGWISKELQNWLVDNLLTSPLVIYEVVDAIKPEYYKVKINNSTVDKAKNYIDGLVEMEVELIIHNENSAVV